MNFHEKYKLYSEAVIGGKGADIDNAKKRMFRQLSSELMTLARLQFIISVVVYLICVILLPGEGFSGMTLKIYPSLAVGYFILFLMYAEIIFLYYFDDLTGAIWTGDLVWRRGHSRSICRMECGICGTAMGRKKHGQTCLLPWKSDSSGKGETAIRYGL